MKFPEIPIETNRSLPHMPQLDGLRAFAVVAVLIHHYIPSGFNFGADLGVKLFFVISGFLITSILIRSRNKAESKAKSRIKALKNFYIRRFLRIFPLYYFVVGAAVIANVEIAREYVIYLLTYTLNLKMAHQGWYITHFAHFWSLSIEEQFYLIWPWIVLLIPRRALFTAILSMISLGPVFRLCCILGWTFWGIEIPGIASYIFTLSCFDTLGIGALLALLIHSNLQEKIISRYVSRLMLPIGLAVFIALYICGGITESSWWLHLLLKDLSVGFVFCWLVMKAAKGMGGSFGCVLSFRPIRYIGKISYGVYVYHPLMPTLLSFFFALAGVGFYQFTVFGFILSTIATFFVSSLSWYLMERPINALKKYYPA